MLGGMAQKGLGRIFGFGEYKEALAGEIGTASEAITESNTPAVNSLVAPLSTNELVPLMHADAEGTIRIARREFIDVIQIANEAIVYQVPIDPGNSVVFPWLHTVAKNYQQYSLLGFAAEYVPTSGVAVASLSAALGQVAMAYKYNVNEAVSSWPTGSLQGMLNMNGSMSCSPAAPGTCYLECDPRMTNQPVKFVRTGEPLSLYYSEQNFDCGTLLIRTEGAQDPQPFQCGQLWITYEIMLMNPRPQNPSLLMRDRFSDLTDELRALKDFIGPMTPSECVRIAARIVELEAFTNSLEFIQERARSARDYSIAKIEYEHKAPPISPAVQALIEEEVKHQEDTTTMPVPPPSPAEDGETLMVDDDATLEHPGFLPRALREVHVTDTSTRVGGFVKIIRQ